jgi:hypothetical protein
MITKKSPKQNEWKMKKKIMLTFFEKMKIGQLFLSIFEIFKIESQMKKRTF